MLCDEDDDTMVSTNGVCSHQSNTSPTDSKIVGNKSKCYECYNILTDIQNENNRFFLHYNK